MTAEELQAAEETYRSSRGQAELLRAVRNETIRAALADGWTQTQISEATGLTRGRIGQIAQGAKCAA